MRSGLKYIMYGVVALTVLLLYAFSFLPFVLPIGNVETYKENIEKDLSRGDFVYPLESVFSPVGEYEVYLYIASEEFSLLNQDLCKYKLRHTGNQLLINELKDSFKCIYTESDACTIESRIWILRNDKLIYESAIAIENTGVGLQNQSYGWVVAQNPQKLVEIFKQFKPVFAPVIYLW